MTKSNIMPFVNSTAEAVELTTDGTKKTYWKKEILPSGTRMYKGQKLDFSKINPACVRAFEDGAFDAVPYVLALSDNSHPKPGEEAERLEGDLHKLEMSDGRLFGYFDLSQSPDAEARIKKSNGKFGVSARIEVDYERDDNGKKYEYALSHVCGTTRPHIKGMSPWSAVELSDTVKGSMTLDFTGEEIIDEDPNTENEGLDMGNILSKEDGELLLSFLKDYKSAEDALKKMDTSGAPNKEEPVVATLSEEQKKAIELSESRANKAFELAEKAQTELAETRWDKMKAELVREGVPPVVLAEAEIVMKSPKKATIQLSDTESIDATEVVTKMLNACKGIVDLSEESGSQLTPKASDQDDKEFTEWARDLGFGDYFADTK